MMRDSVEVREFTDGHRGLFPQGYDRGKATIDGEGEPWLTIEVDDSERRVGIGSENVMAAASDPELAFQLMLGRVAQRLG